MLKDIQDWFPIKSYLGRIIALLLFILSLLAYYLWLYPFLTYFDQRYYYFRVFEGNPDSKTSIEFTIPKYVYSSEIREISVKIENQTYQTVKNLSLQVVVNHASSSRISIGSNSPITFEDLKPDMSVYGKMPFSIIGLNNGDEVELSFLYIEEGQTQLMKPRSSVKVQLDRWKALANSILEKMLFPPFSLAFIFTIVVISCSLFEEKEPEQQPVPVKSLILQTARILLLASGGVLLISGTVIGLVTHWHIISLIMIFSGILLTMISPKKQAKRTVVKTRKIVISASGEEKEVEMKE